MSIGTRGVRSALKTKDGFRVYRYREGCRKSYERKADDLVRKRDQARPEHRFVRGLGPARKLLELSFICN